MISIIDNNTGSLLSLALDAASMRHQAIAHNIANANTEGYQAIDVRFEQSLADARDAVRQLPTGARADLTAFRSAFEFVDTNAAVAIDVEVAKLSENTLYQQTLLKALNRHMSLLSTAISDGKR